MLYKFNKDSLMFEKINRFKLMIRPIFLTFFVASLLSLAVKKEVTIPEEEKLIVLKEYNSFSEAKLVEKIASLNFKFPYIVLAQAKLESNNYKSFLFKQNNNLFGMKEPVTRLNLATGTEHGYAVYTTWSESVMDYALYCATYLKDINTEREYYQYLAQYYAEDTSYVNKVKGIINEQNLKPKFN